MTTKQLNVNQCVLLHERYGSDDCCLCKSREENKELLNRIVDLTDDNLKKEAIIKELVGYETNVLVRAGVQSTHEPCPVCNTRGFTNGIACTECGGLGMKKLEKPIMMPPMNTDLKFTVTKTNCGSFDTDWISYTYDDEDYGYMVEDEDDGEYT